MLRFGLSMVLAAIISASAIGAQSSQGPGNNSELVRRVDILEAMIVSLQKRVDALERQGATRTVATIPAGRESWRRLSKGMSMADVRSILGEPAKVNAGPLTTWYYLSGVFSSGNVVFDSSSRVMSWAEP
jgi:hypothetical protein